MFWTRLASGVVLLAVAIGAMSLGGIPLALLLWVISLIAFRELTRALKCASDEKKPNGLEIIGFLGITGYYLLLYFTGDFMLLMMCAVGVFLAVMFAYVFLFPKIGRAHV